MQPRINWPGICEDLATSLFRFCEAGLRRALARGLVPEASHTDALLATMPLK